MSHQLVIRGGLIVDGEGRAPFAGDIAVDNGVLTQVGGRAGSADQVIDADGLVVTPGFIDIHTHLDAQLGWDPLATPVSWHGVTTVLTGNCGVTFAPCRPADREALAGMMETVEDIPRDAILNGLPWDWEDYPGYLDSIDRMRPAVNVAGLVGHSAVRVYVMGERAVDEVATEAEQEEMSRIVGASLDGGAFGFSTNRYPNHRLPDGRSVPGTYASLDEIVTIARAVSARDGLMQNVLDFRVPELECDKSLIRQSTEAAARVLFSFTVSSVEDAGRKAGRFLDKLRSTGGNITAATMPRGTGFLFGLQSRLPAHSMRAQALFGPAWQALAAKDLFGRVAAIGDPAFTSRLVAEARAVEDSTLDWLKDTFYIGRPPHPTYMDSHNDSLCARAQAAGEHWSEMFLRFSLESEGKGLFLWRMINQNAPTLGDLLVHEAVVPGLSDAGAHVAQVSDCGAATFFLSYWVRDRQLFSLAEGVRRITKRPAEIIGISDRGTLREGMVADINLIDLAALGEGYPEIVHDFPGGAPRLVQRSRGYHTTIVNGAVTWRDGQHAGACTGRVLRRGSSPAAALASRA